MTISERRPVDSIDEWVGITKEAAELAEHIRDTKPEWKREELMDELIDMIDGAHEEALDASGRLKMND